MNRVRIPCVLLMLLSACTPQQTLEPWQDNFGERRSAAIAKDARVFIIRRQGCDHFRGEPGSDKERQKFLNENIQKLCKGSDVELARLRAKYVDQTETMKALASFEDCIEFDIQCVATKQE